MITIEGLNGANLGNCDGTMCGLGAYEVAGGDTVAALQRTLANMSSKYQDGKLNPRRTDGLMTMGTAVATFNAAKKVGDKVDVKYLSTLFDAINWLVNFDVFGQKPLAALLSPAFADTLGTVLTSLRNSGVSLATAESKVEQVLNFVKNNASMINTTLSLVDAVSTMANAPSDEVAASVPTSSLSKAALAITRPTAAVAALRASGTAAGSVQLPYPTGSVARWHRTEKVWWIFAPGSPLSGLGADGIVSTVTDVTSAAGTLITKVAGEAGITPAGTNKGAPLGTPWYANWKYLLPIGLGVVAAGGGTYYYVRHRKHATSTAPAAAF